MFNSVLNLFSKLHCESFNIRETAYLHKLTMKRTIQVNKLCEFIIFFDGCIFFSSIQSPAIKMSLNIFITPILADVFRVS